MAPVIEQIPLLGLAIIGFLNNIVIKCVSYAVTSKLSLASIRQSRIIFAR